MGDIKAYPYILYVEMANCLGLLPSTLSKFMLSKEKITDAEFKCEAQTNKRKNMKLGAYDELKRFCQIGSNKCILYLCILMYISSFVI
jgi:hypothetical protein